MKLKIRYYKNPQGRFRAVAYDIDGNHIGTGVGGSQLGAKQDLMKEVDEEFLGEEIITINK